MNSLFAKILLWFWATLVMKSGGTGFSLLSPDEVPE